MIFSTDPLNWRDLQDKVASILQISGFESTVEQTIHTTRGDVVVDVHAVDTSANLKLTYLCECKYWSRAVPKTVIHSFRSVVSDYGADIGFLISRNGFQRGAFEAAQNTNIRLVDWSAFQGIFIDQWKEGRYSMLRKKLEDLFEFYDCFSGPNSDIAFENSEDIVKFKLLLNRFAPQAKANPWNRILEPMSFPPILPHSVIELNETEPTKFLTFTDYATLFDWYEKRTDEGLEEFANFHKIQHAEEVDT